ncbi:ubiE/COQ5 methyltransferase [Purpureocillium lavendulum]|uniref:UbiE/COQ5 methyltransferase n=1 Tax=Purpureocillium lavendulum TaxID=1247861 RepID=A0AB34G9Q9_9HYPO|nr:ubiE/COQ5 methyltransferase [Purpureocillium lavendulum]
MSAPAGPQRKSEAATYTHGHHASVLRSHTWRTAANSAAFLLPHLRPGMRVLDVGCGPGTITVDLAALVAPGGGRVTGVERAADVLVQARSLASARGLSSEAVEFVVGDANALDFPDGAFDVVFCHQVLQHVKDPVGVLREMRRVAKPAGGIVAARESDYGAFAWFPHIDGMEAWRALYRRVAAANGGEPDAGRMVHAWARAAGFSSGSDGDENGGGGGGGGDVVTASSSSSWCYSTPDEVAWWSGLWAERTVASAFARTATEAGAGTEEELAAAAEAWRRWGREPDAWFAVPSGEVLCRRGVVVEP